MERKVQTRLSRNNGWGGFAPLREARTISSNPKKAIESVIMVHGQLGSHAKDNTWHGKKASVLDRAIQILCDLLSKGRGWGREGGMISGNSRLSQD